ncbi:MAG: hypothetical protein WCR23_12040 [Planctomycetota bacterium]
MISLQRGIRVVNLPKIKDLAADLLAELSRPVRRQWKTPVGLPRGLIASR